MTVTAPRSEALVFFGATGDLADKQIFPALQAMIRHGRLDLPIVAVAKAGWNLEQLRARVRDSLAHHGGVDEAAFARLCARLSYIDGDYRDAATFTALRAALGKVQRSLHYLAIPPSMFTTVAEGLAKSGCAKDARVVIEKPFGHDLASARQLNATLHQFFPDEAIFRIDHYLGKEPVQNLIYFRFANPLFEATFNNRHVDSVQITMAENFGVRGRGRFYEEAGAIRDVLQNHLMKLVACLTMEAPSGRGHEATRDERATALAKVRSLAPTDVARGQFRGYRAEPGVAADSQVETFAAVRLLVDSPRWEGVPFYIRTGKCLPVTTTEVMVRFKRSAQPVLDDSDTGPGNYIRFRLSPEIVIALGTRAKQPGEAMTGTPIELVAVEAAGELMAPYERLLGDAAAGDATLFAREDAVETQWRIVDAILGNVTPVYPYDPNTWGPREADGLIPEGAWHNPLATATAAAS
jgi:glucose-6-phosphate 1-dehydrogenase